MPVGTRGTCLEGAEAEAREVEAAGELRRLEPAQVVQHLPPVTHTDSRTHARTRTHARARTHTHSAMRLGRWLGRDPGKARGRLCA